MNKTKINLKRKRQEILPASQKLIKILSNQVFSTVTPFVLLHSGH